MANVFLTPEAYAKLKAAKKPGESFSDVVIKLVPQTLDLDEFVGSCKGLDAKKLTKEIREERNRR